MQVRHFSLAEMCDSCNIIRVYLFTLKCPSDPRVAQTALLISNVAQQMSHCLWRMRSSALSFVGFISSVCTRCRIASFADDLLFKPYTSYNLISSRCVNVGLVPPVGDVMLCIALLVTYFLHQSCNISFYIPLGWQ